MLKGTGELSLAGDGREMEMPSRDGTGPLGEGPHTGRGLGPFGGGLAHRHGRGGGRGRGDSFGHIDTSPASLLERLGQVEATVEDFKAQLGADSEK
jgi:hypothetical protein